MTSGWAASCRSSSPYEEHPHAPSSALTAARWQQKSPRKVLSCYQGLRRSLGVQPGGLITLAARAGTLSHLLSPLGFRAAC